MSENQKNNAPASPAGASSQVTYLEDKTVQEFRYNLGGNAYILRPARGKAAMQYRNETFKAARLNQAGQTTFDGLANAESLLVSLCLRKLATINKDGAMVEVEFTVPRQVIEDWPYKTMKALYEKAQEISQLGQDQSKESVVKQIADLQSKLRDMEENSPKDEPSVTQDGSA